MFSLSPSLPWEGSGSVTIDAFGTNPDGTLLDSSNPPDFYYDTTLGIRIKSASGSPPTTISVTPTGSTAEAWSSRRSPLRDIRRVRGRRGAYSDDVPLNYGLPIRRKN